MMQDEQIIKMLIEMKENIAALNVELRATSKRIDEQRALTETVQRLEISVGRLIGETNQTSAEVGRLRQDLDMLKERPAKRWESLIAALITSSIAFLIGRFL